MSRPLPGTFPAYFDHYINLVETSSAIEAIDKYSDQLIIFFSGLPEEKANYKYAEDKWTLKDVLQHIIDCERIFAYRALTIARGDKTPLPGFDENLYAKNSNSGNRTWSSLLNEFKLVRQSSDILLKNLNNEQLQQIGTSNNNPMSVNALVYIFYGHILHHINIINERYL